MKPIITKVFKCGNSYAVRIPKQFALEGGEVALYTKGKNIVMTEIPNSLAEAYDLFCSMPKDFYTGGRKDTKPQDRDFK